MDKSVLWKLTYGMYAVGTLAPHKPTGCIVNTVVQISGGDPDAENEAWRRPIIAISMNKNNYTLSQIKSCGKLTVSILSEKADPKVIGTLGFSSGRDVDKFADLAYKTMGDLPIVADDCVGYIAADFLATQDAQTHEIVLARVTDSVLGTCDAPPMTYKYYHDILKGSAPKEASTALVEEVAPVNAASQVEYVCPKCGYVHKVDIMQESENYVCPICGVPRDQFTKK